MGVEDWESKYKVPESGVLDDYLDAEQKIWEDEDKSIIYRISDSPYESKGSRFYQTVECDALSPEDTEEPNGRPRRQRRGFGSGEVRLVYKEAGSFEDESSPPEIDIIPSVKQLRQQTDTECLLYKTRLWAKTALEDTLESYAAFREEEAAREEAARIRVRREYGSVGSDEMQYSFGSEEELEELTFTEGDASYEYESYYYPSKYMPFGGQGYSSKGRTGRGQDPMLSPVEEPSDEYVDAMDELQCLVHSVSEYLAVKEEEINNYESMPTPIRRKLPALPTDAKVVQPGDSGTMATEEGSATNEVKPEIKEDSTVEQGIAGVKNAMSSLFSTITGSKSTTDTEASGTTPSSQPPQADSGLSKLLSMIPKASAEATETSASSPEEETVELKLNECSKPELPEDSASEDITPIAVTLPDCKDSLTADITAQSDISDDARATDISSTEALIKSEEVKNFSPEMSVTQTTAGVTDADEHDQQHILTKKSLTIEASLSEAEVTAETTEACEPSLELSFKERKSIAPDMTPLEVVKPLSDLACQAENKTSVLAPPEGAETLNELAHDDKSTTSDVVLPDKVRSLDKLSLKEVPSDIKSPEGVQQLDDKTEKDVSLSAPEPSPVKTPTEEITTSKEDILAVKAHHHHSQPHKNPREKAYFLCLVDPIVSHHLVQEVQLLEVHHLEDPHPKNLQAKACFPCLVDLPLSNHPVPEVLLGLVLDRLYLAASSQVLLHIKKLLVQVHHWDLLVLHHSNSPGKAWSGHLAHPDKEWELQGWELQGWEGHGWEAHGWGAQEWQDHEWLDQDIQDHRSPLNQLHFLALCQCFQPQMPQDEKPAGKDEPSSTSSVFGMTLGSMFGNSDPPKPESCPPVVTVQPQSQSPKPTDEFCEPESEKLSPVHQTAVALIHQATSARPAPSLALSLRSAEIQRRATPVALIHLSIASHLPGMRKKRRKKLRKNCIHYQSLVPTKI
eukprot:superscaffoldBa00003001_g15855